MLRRRLQVRYSYLVNTSPPLKLSRSQRGFMSRAVRLASSSTVSQRHGALVVRGGSVLSAAVNSYSNDPRAFPVSYFGDNKLSSAARAGVLSTHAEVAAIRRVAPELLRGATVYVARLTPGGSLGGSAPCDACAKALADAGVKRVLYT